ncbi:synaptic plasticity regulator PANTS-like [Ptychodera flava]|uniref:synaptic plasticity regulator PANTS-like n=1 Tax=Ptychodera flava TaxID=63121 RepID=UPI00396A5B9D
MEASSEKHAKHTKILPCSIYKRRFTDCKSIGNWIHSFYVYGKSPECDQMKLDYEICKIWERTGDEEAQERMMERESQRQEEKRKRPPVWELRTSPPEDWHKPLPNQES